MRRTVTLAAAAAAVLGGCGGDGGGGRTVTVPAGKPLVVKADEFKFDPSHIVLRSGGPVRIELRNEGAQAHDLRVERDGDDVGGTPVFGPGQAKTAAVTLAPGDYEFICSVGDHAAQGMKGTLTVR